MTRPSTGSATSSSAFLPPQGLAPYSHPLRPQHQKLHRRNQPCRRRHLVAVMSPTLVGLVLAFVFFAFFADKFSETKLELEIEGNKVSISTAKLRSPESKIEEIDLESHYIDSTRGFSFERPNSGNWSDPQHLEGFDAVIDAKTPTLPSEVRERILSRVRVNPLGRMIRRMVVVRLTSGAPIVVEITDDSSTEELDSTIERMREEAEKKGESFDGEFARRLLKRTILFESINFSNEFTVTILEKKYAKGTGIKLSLPGLFLTFAGNFGFGVDKLVADENTILAAVTGNFERVNIDGRQKDFRVDRWMLMTERAERYYIVEVAYSPQTSSSVEVWRQLRQMMDTFRIHDS